MKIDMPDSPPFHRAICYKYNGAVLLFNLFAFPPNAPLYQDSNLREEEVNSISFDPSIHLRQRCSAASEEGVQPAS